MTWHGRSTGRLDVVRLAYAAVRAQDVEVPVASTDGRLMIVEDNGLPFRERYQGCAVLAAFLTRLRRQFKGDGGFPLTVFMAALALGLASGQGSRLRCPA